MIKVFCQYSIGGFGVYEVDEKTQGKFSHAITNDNMRGYPREAIRFFSISGYKLAYYEVNQLLIITLKNIPGLGKNSDGSPIPYSIQFVGDLSSDKSSMDRLCMWIASDIIRAQDSFHSILTKEDGIGIDTGMLDNILKEAETKSCQYNELIEKIPRVRSKLKLLVTYSFTKGENGNEFVARPLTDALHLSYESDKDAICITVKELSLKGRYPNLLRISQKPHNNKKKMILLLMIIIFLIAGCGICWMKSYLAKKESNSVKQVALIIKSLESKQADVVHVHNDSIDRTYYEGGFSKDSLTLRFYFNIIDSLDISSLTEKDFKISDNSVKLFISKDIIHIKIDRDDHVKCIHKNRHLANDSIKEIMFESAYSSIDRKYNSKETKEQVRRTDSIYLSQFLHSNGLSTFEKK